MAANDRWLAKRVTIKDRFSSTSADIGAFAGQGIEIIQWDFAINPVKILVTPSSMSDVFDVITKWAKKQCKSDQSGPLIHLETGNEIKKQFFILVPYFPGLSEAYKKIFKYRHIQVCFKGINTLKSLLMHPKDKVSIDQKKNLVYHWQCQADGHKSYVGETSHSLGERAKEHAKSTMSAIHTVLTSTTPCPQSPILP